MIVSRSAILLGLCSVVLSGCGVSGTSESRIPSKVSAPDAEVFRWENSPRSASAIASLQAGHYHAAANESADAVNADPTDMVARFIHGTALVMVGDYERARGHLSLAMAWHPRVADAYPRRAVCAARMGDKTRAQSDMQIAGALDPEDINGVQKWAKEQLKVALKGVTSKDPESLSTRLFRAAHDGEPYNTLQAIADELLQASNVNRLIGDETYAENCRQLDWYVAASPNDPDRLFRFGRFLLDELEVQEHYVETGNQSVYYRMQGRILWRAEIERARGYFQRALQVDSNHVGALIGMARLESRLGMYANAENYLRRAMAIGDPDPEVLYMMRNIMAKASGQQMASSIALTQVRRWSERHGNYIYHYVSYPTAEAYRQAREHDKAADRMMKSSVDYRKELLDLNADDARTHDYIALMARQYKDYESAERGWKRALELDPDNHQVSYALAEVYARQNRVEEYLEQSTRTWTDGRHTSAVHYLRWAWDKINQRRFDEAEAALKQAIEVDAGDSRTLAYLGVVAEARGDKSTAKSYYKAAFALEEAHAKQRGASYLNGAGRWYPNDMGLALEMRMRLALISEDEGNPGDALIQYQGIFSMESKIGDQALDDDLYTAMLPIPGFSHKSRPHAPRWGEYMRTSRALAGYLYYKDGNTKAAEEQFRMLRDYEKRMSTAGIRAGRYLSDTVWKSQQVAEAAYDIFKSRNDASQYHWWERETRKYRQPSSADWRKNKSQSPPDLSSGVRL